MQDFSEEWQGLDDLIQVAVEGEDSATAGNASVVEESHVEKKLRDLDALLKPPAESVVGCADEAGVRARKSMEAFLGGGVDGAGRDENDTLRQDELGEEEERLLQMVSFAPLCVLCSPRLKKYARGYDF